MKRTILLAAAILAMGFMPQSTPTVTAAWTTICETRTSLYQHVQFKVTNTGGANPFTDCRVQVWAGPDSPSTGDWETVLYPWKTCAALAAGEHAVVYFKDQSYERIRVQAKSAAGTSAYCRPYGTGKD